MLPASRRAEAMRLKASLYRISPPGCTVLLTTQNRYRIFTEYLPEPEVDDAQPGNAMRINPFFVPKRLICLRVL